MIGRAIGAATKLGQRFAGTELGKQLASEGAKKFAREAAVGAALEGGVGIAAEQLLPRAMGQQPQASLVERVLRQGTAAAVGSPIAAGLGRVGVPGAAAQLAGQLAGQPAGQAVAQAILPGNQQYPLGADPEPHQAGHAGYGDLMALQQMEAAREQQRAENQIALAYARNYSAPSFVYHRSSGNVLDTVQNMMKEGSRGGY